MTPPSGRTRFLPSPCLSARSRSNSKSPLSRSAPGISSPRTDCGASLRVSRATPGTTAAARAIATPRIIKAPYGAGCSAPSLLRTIAFTATPLLRCVFTSPWDEKTQRSRGVAVNAIVRKSEGAEQPAPYGALMIRGVAIARAATVVPGIARLTRSEASQSVRGEEIPGADLDNGLLLFERERADRQADGKNLVRPEGGVISYSG